METTFNINKKSPGYCGYVAMYAGQCGAIYAPSQWRAVQVAREFFKAPKTKQHLISVIVAEDANGDQIIHSTSNI